VGGAGKGVGVASLAAVLLVGVLCVLEQCSVVRYLAYSSENL
jgi:hypothetical protein